MKGEAAGVRLGRVPLPRRYAVTGLAISERKKRQGRFSKSAYTVPT